MIVLLTAFLTAQSSLSLSYNPDMSDGVESSEVTLVDFFPDCGAVPQQMTACEINLAIDTEEKIS